MWRCNQNKHVFWTVLFLLVLHMTAAGSPLPDSAGTSAAFEIEPYSGVMGGSGMFGIKMGMNYGAVQFGLSAAQVIGESADLFPVLVGLSLNLVTGGRLLPYATAGGGLFVTVPTHAVGARTVSAMSANAGAGLRIILTRSIGLRLEIRQHATNIRDEFIGKYELLYFRELGVGVSFLIK